TEIGETLPFNDEIVKPARLRHHRKNSSADYIVVDTPPGDPTMIDAAIAVADLVILPTASTAMDLERTIQTAANIPADILRVAIITSTNKQTRSYRYEMVLIMIHNY